MSVRACAAVSCLLALTACGGSSHKSSTTDPASSPSASAVVTEKPMSFYADQYLRIGKPCVDAQSKLRAAVGDAAIIAAAKATSQACQASNAELLRGDWPTNVKADIRAEVLADGPLLGDLADAATNAGSVVRDSGPANAAANIVRADLGLPPIK